MCGRLTNEKSLEVYLKQGRFIILYEELIQRYYYVCFHNILSRIYFLSSFFTYPRLVTTCYKVTQYMAQFIMCNILQKNLLYIIIVRRVHLMQTFYIKGTFQTTIYRKRVVLTGFSYSDFSLFLIGLIHYYSQYKPLMRQSFYKYLRVINICRFLALVTADRYLFDIIIADPTLLHVQHSSRVAIL